MKYRIFYLQISSSQIKGFRDTQQANQDNHDILNVAGETLKHTFLHYTRTKKPCQAAMRVTPGVTHQSSQKKCAPQKESARHNLQ